MNASGMDTAGERLNEQSVRERAYFIWEREGKPHGRDCEHWTRAERELFGVGMMSGTALPAAKATSGKAAKKRVRGTEAAAKSASKSMSKSVSKSVSKTAAQKASSKRAARVTKSAAKPAQASDA